MRRALLVPLAVLATVCAVTSPENKTAALGESFGIKIGESVLIEGEALEIGFEDIPTDSRCPDGAQCIWEGDATVRIWARSFSRAREEYELHLRHERSAP